MILLLALLRTACAAGSASTPTGTSGATAQAPDDTAPAARASAARDGLVLRYVPGGDDPARFRTPEWSVANRTAIDVPGLLIRIDWQDEAGNVLQPVGDYGTLVVIAA